MAQILQAAVVQNMLGKELHEERDLDFVGLGPGAEKMAAEAQDRGLKVAKMDKTLDPRAVFRTPEGRGRVKASVRRLRPGGVLLRWVFRTLPECPKR